MKDCPMCNGYGFDGTEEDTGCPFACYFCGTSGKVSDEVFAEYLRELPDPEYRRLLRPVFANEIDPDDIDDECADYLERRMRILPRVAARKPAPVAAFEYDDIPF